MTGPRCAILHERRALHFWRVLFSDFLDPWGNRIEVVEYRDIQFMKTDFVLRAMSLDLDKTDAAKAELRKKDVKI